MGWRSALRSPPEYKNTKRDTAIALRTARRSCFSCSSLFPLASEARIGAPKAALAEGQYLTGAFSTIVGSGVASFVVVWPHRKPLPFDDLLDR